MKMHVAHTLSGPLTRGCILRTSSDFFFSILRWEWIKDLRRETVNYRATYLRSELLELSAFLLLYVLICVQEPLFGFDNQDDILGSTCLHALSLSYYRMSGSELRLLRTGGEGH